MIWLIALVLLALPQDAAAQRRPRKATPVQPAQEKPAAAPERFPIRSLAVKGAVLHVPSAVLEVAGLAVGQTVTPADLEGTQKRLLESGLFDSAGFEYGPAPGGGYAVTLTVAEAIQRFPFRVDDLPVTDAEARQWLSQNEPLYPRASPATLAATPKALERFRVRLQEWAVTKGFTGRVTARLLSNDPAGPTIVFRPATPPATIAQVQFEGNKAIPTTTLQNNVAGVAVGTAYSEARMREVLNASVRPLYEAQGRVRVAFPSIQAEPARDVKGTSVTVRVEEGPVYQMGPATVTGLARAQEPLVKGVKLPEAKQPFDVREVDAAAERLRRALRRQGFLKAASKTERAVDDTAKTVAVRVAVEPGALYTMGRLTIEGLDIETEPVVRKLWGLKAGQPFDVEYPDLFFGQVREQGIFERLGKTTSRVTLNDESRTADVVLVFGKA